jgi:hypothetical protein
VEKDRMNSVTIGLFGTCDNSAWRDAFMTRYAALGIEYFNPQVADWTPDFAGVEAQHLATDELILFPVLDESLGIGSLAEIGLSIATLLRTNRNRFVVLFVAAKVCDALQLHNPVTARISNQSRALVRAHLSQHAHSNLFIVESLPAMLEVSLHLYQALNAMRAARAVPTGA